MTLDADFNTPAHIDRDEARSAAWGARDDWRDFDDADAITDAEMNDLWHRDPTAWCRACFVHIQDGGCDEHRTRRTA